MAKKKDNKAALAKTASQVPDHLKQYEGSNLGNEGVGQEDLIVPRLEVIQALGKQHVEGHDDYIEGAKMGMLFNTVTQEVYGAEVLIIPCHYKREHLIWKDRKAGGGFKGAFSSVAAAEQELASMDDIERQQCEIQDTGIHFALISSDGGLSWNEITIPMSRSKAKISRQLNSMIRMTNMPRMACKYKLSVIMDTNNNGDEHYNYRIASAGYNEPEHFEMGKTMYDAVAAGEKKMSTEDGGAESSSSDIPSNPEM